MLPTENNHLKHLKIELKKKTKRKDIFKKKKYVHVQAHAYFYFRENISLLIFIESKEIFRRRKKSEPINPERSENSCRRLKISLIQYLCQRL